MERTYLDRAIRSTIESAEVLAVYPVAGQMVECSVDRRVRRSEDTYIARTNVPTGAETIDFGRYMGNLARQVASAHQTRSGAFAQGHRVRIAAPVFEASGAVIGSVSITATTLACEFDEVVMLVPRLLQATAAISSEYGWRPEDRSARASR